MTQGPFSHWQRAVESPNVRPMAETLETLPPVFQFSQNSLQDYVDCARRFQLRYVLGMQWPAAETEPLREHELFMEQGSQFHLLVQRYLLGIPSDKLTPADPVLRRWWEDFLRYPIPNLPATIRLPEVQLTTPLGSQRLLARFDMLAIDPGQRAVIVDWKTSRYRPSRMSLSQRLQSRIYPFVLAEAGSHLFSGPLSPEQITLVYWFSADPAHPEIFDYDPVFHQQNREYFTSLISEVFARQEEVWPLTEDLAHCEYCVYRSLCNRGVKAGNLDAAPLSAVEPDFDFTFELDDIDEISF
jgi:hypothetical protein